MDITQTSIMNFNEKFKSMSVKQFMDLGSITTAEYSKFGVDEHAWLSDSYKELGGATGVYIAGGFLREIFENGFADSNKTDIDIFFQDKQTYDNWTKNVAENKFAIGETKPHCQEYYYKGFKVQAIHVDFFETPYDLIDSFDFTLSQICLAAFPGMGSTPLIYFNKSTPKSIIEKKLELHKITYPVSNLRRMIKYVKKGYYACPGCCFAVAKAISELDPSEDFKDRKWELYPVD